MKPSKHIVWAVQYRQLPSLEWRNYSGVYRSRKVALRVMQEALENAEMRNLEWAFRVMAWDELNQKEVP